MNFIVRLCNLIFNNDCLEQVAHEISKELAMALKHRHQPSWAHGCKPGHPASQRASALHMLEEAFKLPRTLRVVIFL